MSVRDSVSAIDYTEIFGNPFTTHHELSEKTVRYVVAALEAEVTENLAYDHWHPETAGPLQLAVHFLQTRRSHD